MGGRHQCTESNRENYVLGAFSFHPANVLFLGYLGEAIDTRQRHGRLRTTPAPSALPP
jgi:hypothetical protein